MRVLLGSEDKYTFGAMPPLLAPSVSYWIPGRYFVMASFKDINDNNNRLVKTYARLQERVLHTRRRSALQVPSHVPPRGVSCLLLLEAGV